MVPHFRRLGLIARPRRPLPAAILLLATGLPCPRTGSSLPPVSAGQAEQGEKQPAFELPSLLWRQSYAPDGRLMWWNPKPLVELGTTMVCVIYRPKQVDEPGFRRSAIVPPKLLAETLESVQPELRESHRHGIKVIGFGNTILFHPEMLQAEGINPDRLYALDRDGNRVMNASWEKRGVYVSCLNNPQWVRLQTKVALLTARAGLDGIQFDLNPYAVKPGYHCQCSYCLRGWEKYSRKRFGAGRPVPGDAEAGLMDFRKPADRAYRAWRWQVFVDFVKAIEEKVRKIHPGFIVIMNRSSGNPDFMYQAAHGALDVPSSELHRVRLGEESSLHLYRMTEGVNNGRLIGLINSSAQITPGFRYRVALAEAYAGGGCFYATGVEGETFAIGKEFYAFLRGNQDWFEATESDAQVGLLYSWRQHAFLEDPDGSLTAQLTRGRDNYGRTASLLSRLQVTYDCLVVEKGLTAKQLTRYRVIVAPELSLVDDKDAALLAGYVRSGGMLLSVGDLGTLKEARYEYLNRDASLLTAWTGKQTGRGWQTRMGLGEVAYAARANLTDAETVLKLSPEFQEAAESVGLWKQLRIQSGSPVETTIRKKLNRRSIHVIRFGAPEMVVDKSVRLDYQVPDGCAVNSVTRLHPGQSENDVSALPHPPVPWRESNGRLVVDLDRVENYELVGIELRPR